MQIENLENADPKRKVEAGNRRFKGEIQTIKCGSGYKRLKKDVGYSS
jgi:hypothetical protein